MDGQRVLVDTSLFIEHLRAKDKTATRLYRLTSDRDVETCSIVAAEIYYGARTPASEEQARAVLRPFTIHSFTAEMAARECLIVRELRRHNQMQDLRDVMIAATALELELPIATLNCAHFEKIPGVILEPILGA